MVIILVYFDNFPSSQTGIIELFLELSISVQANESTCSFLGSSYYKFCFKFLKELYLWY